MVTSGTADFAALADRLMGATEAQTSTMRAPGERIGDGIVAVLEAVDALRRDEPAAGDVLAACGRALCAAAIFDRVMVSRVDGSIWSPRIVYRITTDGRVVTETVSDDDAGDLDIALASPLIEAEVVRRRLPALVSAADREPRAHRALITRLRTTEYVTAPVVVDNTVRALVHADNADTGRELSAVDRDLLRLYVDNVGVHWERTDLSARQVHQQRMLSDVCMATMGTVTAVQAEPLGAGGSMKIAGLSEQSALMPSATRTRPPVAESGTISARLARLTGREREVLALLASGATNAQLADRLTVAESTVKSHVKHILHKIGAGNRAAAIACYLRESRNDERRTR
ncbi:MAG: LuxR family transcriptional regulator [Mycobacterium sp.]|nr:LuxR family transcriptional regulator [Mycobacterium sp.]